MDGQSARAHAHMSYSAEKFLAVLVAAATTPA
jgi:hypothetical protein